jgi:hypothetical protein
LFSLKKLISTIVNSVRLPDECNDHVAIGGFIQNDFRMAGDDDLARLFRGRSGQEFVRLRLMVTPGRFPGVALPARFSFQRRSPMFQSASAWSAVVFPELLGPTKTTGFPSSICTSLNCLKFLITSFVSMVDAPLFYHGTGWLAVRV